jgi:hypothetical protein
MAVFLGFCCLECAFPVPATGVTSILLGYLSAIGRLPATRARPSATSATQGTDSGRSAVQPFHCHAPALQKGRILEQTAYGL